MEKQSTDLQSLPDFYSQWNLKWHSQFCQDWSEQSFINLYQISNLYDYIKLFNTYKPDIDKLSLYIFRQNICPTWEDHNNKYGGFLSFRVNQSVIGDFWDKMCKIVITENLFYDEELNNQKISNGIQLTQKFFDQKNQNPHFYQKQYQSSSIVKVWLKRRDLNVNLFRYPKIQGMEPPRYINNNI